MSHNPWRIGLPCIMVALLWDPVYAYRKWKLR